MTAVSFSQADVQAIDRVLRILNRLEELLGPATNRDSAYERLDDLSGRMLSALEDEPFLPLLPDTGDHSKHADLRVVEGGRCV